MLLTVKCTNSSLWPGSLVLRLPMAFVAYYTRKKNLEKGPEKLITCTYDNNTFPLLPWHYLHSLSPKLPIGT